MAIRYTVQGDDEQETADGLRLLLAAGLQLAIPPRQLTDQRWVTPPAADAASFLGC